MSPEILFPETSRVFKVVSFPISTGRLPVNELCDKLTETKVESAGNLSGILPLRRLSDMSNVCKFLQLEMPAGMLPSNLLCDKERKKQLSEIGYGGRNWTRQTV